MHYTVQYGDSPASIASRFGIALWQLFGANPQKPVAWVGGTRTWSTLYPGERVRVPDVPAPAAMPAPATATPWAPPGSQSWTTPQWAQPQPVPTPTWQPPWQPPPPAPAPAWPPPQAAPPWRYGGWDRRYGLRGDADTAGVGDLEQGLALHQAQLRRLEWGRRGYEYGGNPYGVAYGVGDAASDAINALLTAGSPCDPNNAPLVCAVQAALGVGVDGKWGTGTAHAARAVVPGAPPACSPRPAWWAPAGQTNCGGPPPPAAAPIPAAPPAPAPPPPPAPLAPAPPAVAPAPPPVVLAPPPPVVLAPPPAAPPFALPPPAPPAVMAMVSLDPCDQANVAAVCAAQAALGVGVDGKWGDSTAQAARAVLPNAPGACTPRPSWWSAVGQSNCGGAPALAPAAAGHAGRHPAAGGGPGASPPALQAALLPSVHPPTAPSGVAVAAVLGALGLAGIVAVMATSSRPVLVTAPVRRAPARRRSPVHHVTHRRAPARRRSRIRRR